MSERKKKRQKYGFIFCVIVFVIALLSLCYSLFILHFGTETLGVGLLSCHYHDLWRILHYKGIKPEEG